MWAKTIKTMTTQEIIISLLLIVTIQLVGVLFAYRMFIDYFYEFISNIAEENDIRHMMKISLLSWSVVICILLKRKVEKSKQSKEK